MRAIQKSPSLQAQVGQMDRAAAALDLVALQPYIERTPAAELVALANLTWLAEIVEQHRRELIVSLRYAGTTWEQIADQLGTTRSAAQQRYGDRPAGRLLDADTAAGAFQSVIRSKGV